MSPNGPLDEVPISGLEELELDASPRFLAAVRNRIDRRRSGAQLLTFFCEVPHSVAVEFLFLFSQVPHLFQKDPQDGNPTKTD